MKIRNILSTFALCALTIVLILLIGSRYGERGTVISEQGGSLVHVSGSVSGIVPDNDTENIAQAPVTPSPPPTPRPTVYKPDVDINSWEFMLVNSENSIGLYAPQDNARIEDGAQYFDSRAVDALEQFLQAARDAGYTPYINTAYRPYSAQEYLFNGKASQIAWGGTYTYEEAVEMAKSIVAFPGTSEHQTGLAADITDKFYSTLDASKMDQGLLTWLREHCAEYGFILRYPADKVSITGWDEPWHFRYVGVEAAEYIMENGLCLEEFLKLYD